MSSYPLPYVASEAARKAGVMNHTPVKYFVSSMLAGMLIAVVLSVSLMLGQALRLEGSLLYYAASAGFFGTALCSIIVGRVELFTSNIMYMTVGRMAGRISSADMLKSWAIVYFGNFAGALLFAVVYAQTGVMANLPVDHLLYFVVGHKVAAAFWAIFWKGVLCNWIICLAVWLPLRLSNDMAKLALIMLLVFVFFFSGYEHSIANMAFFSLSWMFSVSGTPGLSDTLHNMIPATLGNIVGGGLGVGALMFYLERDTLGEVESEAASAPQSAPVAPASRLSHG